jgi:DNA polymerase-1
MSLAFRAYFALPPDLATSEGVVTNALHGFASMLLSIVRDHQPGALAVAFDLPGGTFRDDLVEEYKGGRAETPDDLLPQFDMIKQLVEVLAIPIVSKPRFEADDVLATLATSARDVGRSSVVVTGDRDCFQLVEDPYIRVLYNRRGVSDYTLYDEAGIIERTGLEPARYPMLAALRGDPSDNLPGVPGVGEKTAAKLLHTYGDLPGIFANLEALTPKLRENMSANEERALKNFEVMTLVRDVPLAVDPQDLELGGWDRAEAQALFERYELNSIWRRTVALLDAGAFGSGTGGASTPPLATSNEPLESSMTGSLEISVLDEVGSIPVAESAATGRHTVALSAAGDLLATAAAGSSAVAIVPVESPSSREVLCSVEPMQALDSKRVLRAAITAGNESPAIPSGDAGVAGYLLDAASGDYGLRALMATYLPSVAVNEESATEGQLALDQTADRHALASEVVAVDQLLLAMEPRLEDEGLGALYRDIELPLVRVLARMEDRGIAVDVEVLRSITEDLTQRVGALEASIQELAGHPFKVNSTPQLRQVLFEELGLPPGRKTKTGFSTDASTLEGLLGQHPIIEALLRYRELEKLRSTYGDTLLAEVQPDGRIHATFRQTVARTGRLSSEQPNLHNIPVRSEEGRRFREAFVPTPGWGLLVADYDQVELRIIAHLSGDEGLLAAFASGEDIHRSIAAGVFGVEPASVSHEQRERAKMVSYGLAYGMEAFGLARRLGGDIGEAKEIMDRYFAAFPAVKGYMDATVAEARAQGFTRTELGRIRPLPELISGPRAAQAAAERQAMNAGIQGLAADIFKVALVRLDRRLETEDLAARIVLQVHDEVLVEAPPDERERAEAATIEELTQAAALRVPLKVSLGWGSSWATAKG